MLYFCRDHLFPTRKFGIRWLAGPGYINVEPAGTPQDMKEYHRCFDGGLIWNSSIVDIRQIKATV
jgi:hypothetical protein